MIEIAPRPRLQARRMLEAPTLVETSVCTEAPTIVAAKYQKHIYVPISNSPPAVAAVTCTGTVSVFLQYKVPN